MSTFPNLLNNKVRITWHFQFFFRYDVMLIGFFLADVAKDHATFLFRIVHSLGCTHDTVPTSI